MKASLPSSRRPSGSVRLDSLHASKAAFPTLTVCNCKVLIGHSAKAKSPTSATRNSTELSGQPQKALAPKVCSSTATELRSQSWKHSLPTAATLAALACFSTCLHRAWLQVNSFKLLQPWKHSSASSILTVSSTFFNFSHCAKAAGSILVTAEQICCFSTSASNKYLHRVLSHFIY